MRLYPFQTLPDNKFLYVLIIQRMSSPLAKFIPPSFRQWGSFIFSLFPVLSNSNSEPSSNYSFLLREPCSNYSSLFERTGVQTYSFQFQETRLSHFKRTMFQTFLTLSTDKLPQRLRFQWFLQMVGNYRRSNCSTLFQSIAYILRVPEMPLFHSGMDCAANTISLFISQSTPTHCPTSEINGPPTSYMQQQEQLGLIQPWLRLQCLAIYVLCYKCKMRKHNNMYNWCWLC